MFYSWRFFTAKGRCGHALRSQSTLFFTASNILKPTGEPLLTFQFWLCRLCRTAARWSQMWRLACSCFYLFLRHKCWSTTRVGGFTGWDILSPNCWRYPLPPVYNFPVSGLYSILLFLKKKSPSIFFLTVFLLSPGANTHFTSQKLITVNSFAPVCDCWSVHRK